MIREINQFQETTSDKIIQEKDIEDNLKISPKVIKIDETQNHIDIITKHEIINAILCGIASVISIIIVYYEVWY